MGESRTAAEILKTLERVERWYRRFSRKRARAARSGRNGPVGDLLVKNSQTLSGIVGGHASISETAHGADDRDHRVGGGQLEAEPYPVFQGA